MPPSGIVDSAINVTAGGILSMILVMRRSTLHKVVCYLSRPSMECSLGGEWKGSHLPVDNHSVFCVYRLYSTSS